MVIKNTVYGYEVHKNVQLYWLVLCMTCISLDAEIIDALRNEW